MVKVGLFVRLHAKAGKEAELAKLLEGGLSIVQEEGETPLWFAVKFDSRTFAIFDAFNTEAGRQAHLSGRLAAALMAKASDLLAQPPNIEKVDVLASKVKP
jgi:quinol monooxygenase YgiN